MEDLRDYEVDEEDDDNLFDEDMEALRRACMITGTNPDHLSAAAAGESISDEEKLGIGGGDDEEEGDYDLELVQNIRNRFSNASETFDHDLLKPLCSLPPTANFTGGEETDEDEDFETLRAIQKRFAAYGNDPLRNSPENSLEKKDQVLASSNDLYIHRVDASNEFIDSEETSRTVHQLGENLELNPTNSSKSTSQPNYSNFPKSAKVFMDAIKKNRSFQKFLRSKLIQIEAKIEENKKLKERVKILKDFQVTCKKRTGRALSQKKDPRVQLISKQRTWASKDLKVPDKKIPAMFYGPQENSHVANYRIALAKYPLSIDRKKWSELEKKNLEKGIRQQFQEMVLQNMVDRLSDLGDSGKGFNDIDSILASVKNINITPENIREFLPKFNWDQLASLYVVGRSGAECESRWLNFDDPLINHNPWTAQEDKNILFFVQNNGISNWFEISVSLGTDRTPFQCLARYQRSLNVSILKREWTKDDDTKLRNAVEAFGECNWQAVASSLEGWTGTQCSNRWKKSLHPTREKVGRWTDDEDKRLTVAQMLFGPKNWKKIAQFVPGRTEVQCRERWVNSLDPSLNWEKWTPEEDSKLREAITEHGYCWSKVAAALPRRTDNMCRRRWKRLLPHEVPLLQAARRMQKAALICNFVDRESERPAIGLNDFCPLTTITSGKDVNLSTKQTKKSKGLNPGKKKIKSGSKMAKERGPKNSKKHSQASSGNALAITNNGELVTFDGQEITTNQGSENGTGLDGKSKKRPRKPHSKKKELSEAEQGKDKECPELHPESSNLTGNGDTVEPLIESNITSAKKTRAPSKRRGRKKQSAPDVGPSAEAEVSCCVDPTRPMETNGEEIVGSVGLNVGPAPERSTSIKQGRKRKKGQSELMGVSCMVLCLGESDDETTISCVLSNRLKKRKNDQKESLPEVASSNACESTCSVDVENRHETTNGGVSQASFAEKESEKKSRFDDSAHPRCDRGAGGPGVASEKQPSEDNSEAIEADMTLACFLQSRSKMKRFGSSKK